MNEELEETINKLKQDYELAKSEDSIDIDVFTADLETILNYIENSISKEVIEKKIEKLDKEYKEILSDYGNIDTDVIFDIPNKNVRKHLDELITKIIILQELLKEK